MFHKNKFLMFFITLAILSLAVACVPQVQTVVATVEVEKVVTWYTWP